MCIYCEDIKKTICEEMSNKKEFELKATIKFIYKHGQIEYKSMNLNYCPMCRKGADIMLKIKDEVDLKELEKFGFEHSYSKHGKCIENNYYKNDSNIIIYADYPTDTNGRKITRNFPRKIKTWRFTNETTDDTLYDLISNGLVEKV